MTGAVETVSSACAASALAIEQALRAIRRGEVEVAFTGGADCLCVTTYAGFNSLRAVDERPCRPFRADRAGLSLGEGAAVLVLESLDHAMARGAAPLAELLGAGASCDASHMTAPSPDGSWAAEAMRRALADAGLDSAAIDFLNAHGTATPLNDAAEAAAIGLVFGDRARALPVEATKGVVGHLLGAAGAVEAVATIVSLRRVQVHPTPGRRVDRCGARGRRGAGPAAHVAPPAHRDVGQSGLRRRQRRTRPPPLGRGVRRERRCSSGW